MMHSHFLIPFSRSRTSRVATVALAAAALMVLAGCTGQSDDAKPNPSDSPSPSASETTQPGITDITDTPGSGEGLVGALADSTVSTCALADGAWNVVGSVKNPTEDTADYRIYVSLLSAAGDTRALQQVDVDGVDAGDSADWSTTIPVADDGLSCVLRVERYTA